MSFMDPDYRERLEKESREKKEACKKNGCVFKYGECSNCGAKDPKPRVVLQTDSLRAVFNPANSMIVFEEKGTDALGGDKWFEIDRLGTIYSKNEKSLYHIYKLLVYGKVP